MNTTAFSSSPSARIWFPPMQPQFRVEKTPPSGALGMSGKESFAEVPRAGIIPIHFDVSEHSLPLRTFIETAKQTQTIIEVFNKQVFDEQLHFQILVLPPEPGSFLAKLKVVIVAGSILGALETDLGNRPRERFYSRAYRPRSLVLDRTSRLTYWSIMVNIWLSLWRKML